jgi:DNA-binding response OmpR family regulator
VPPKVLVVDDDKSILDVVRRYLSGQAYVVIATNNGSEALMLARECQPDLVLVDAEMPGLDGHAVCRILKKESTTQAIPVVIMSGAWISDADVLSGFARGADDYIMKPFSLPILKARMEAVLRRYKSSNKADEKLKKAGIEVYPAGRTVSVKGKPISLTRKEFDLLTALIEKCGRVLSIPYLLEMVWGYDPADYNDPGTVEVHVSHLRKKLGTGLGRRIINLPGHGYKFEE